MNDYEKLFREWAEKLISLQITDCNDKSINGAIYCPACKKIHGRCFDAIYAFMYLADKDSDKRYLGAAKLLFDWAENNVSQSDGSYYNDVDSDWKGITVFTVIQLLETLHYHKHILDKNTIDIWSARIKKAAEFLYSYEVFDVCNVNYKTSNCLAMEMCARYFDEEKYHIKAKLLEKEILSHISEEGFYFGEGRPITGYSDKKCRSVDIGYNLEESIPSIVTYAKLTHNKEMLKAGITLLNQQLKFMLNDGSIDNSFGTRNYKWSYWGSRTSDGMLATLLEMGEYNEEYLICAKKHFELLRKCTKDGLLFGGRDYYDLGEQACVHHTFSHIKVLTNILNKKLYSINTNVDTTIPRKKLKNINYYKDIDTYICNSDEYTATIIGYDWNYLNAGHTSGGAMGMLWNDSYGVMLCASMSEYSLKEKNNMQVPRLKNNHECLTPRIEVLDNNIIYSNIFDNNVNLKNVDNKKIEAKGKLADKNNEYNNSKNYNYKFEYTVSDNVKTNILCDMDFDFILPIICRKKDEIILNNNYIEIIKEDCKLILDVEIGNVSLPNKHNLIYNLCPGLSAVKIQINSISRNVNFALKCVYKYDKIK